MVCFLIWVLVTLMCKASLVAQMVKNLPAMQEIWVQFLGGQDPLETKMATHSSILAWGITWTEGSCWLYIVHGATESQT